MGGRGSNGTRNQPKSYDNDEFDEEMENDQLRSDYESRTPQESNTKKDVPEQVIRNFEKSLNNADTLRKLGTLRNKISAAQEKYNDYRGELNLLLRKINDEYNEYR